MEIRTSRNVDREAYKNEEFAISRTVVAEVERNRKSRLIIDAGSDEGLKLQESVVRYGLRSILCAPLVGRDKLLGVIYLDNRSVSGLFSQDKLEVLEALNVQAAISIENAQLYARAVGAEGELRKLNLNLETQVKERTRELIETQRKLLQSEKMASLTRTVGGIAHELNNPLTVILGFAKILSKAVKESDNSYLPVSNILCEAQKCKELVRNLLQFWRDDISEEKEVDINVALKDVLTLGMLEKETAGARIVSDFEPGLRAVQANPTQLQQVVINLIYNALDAVQGCGRQGEVRLSTRHQVDGGKYFAEITVEDNGCGMADEVKKAIFDPFFTTKEQGKGMGLGLTFVYEIVKRHDGEIYVDSEPGKGSSFMIRLPCYDK